MTLPFFLEYALRTGNQPGNRMRPWLDIASFTTEEEWLALIEHLGAPINPDDPAERGRPYAPRVQAIGHAPYVGSKWETGDPRTNNRTAMVLTIQTQQVAMTRSHSFTMPQGSIYLFVVNTDLPQTGAVPPTPEGLQVAFHSGGATLSWSDAPGATGYRNRSPAWEMFSASSRVFSADSSNR